MFPNVITGVYMVGYVTIRFGNHVKHLALKNSFHCVLLWMTQHEQTNSAQVLMLSYGRFRLLSHYAPSSIGMLRRKLCQIWFKIEWQVVGSVCVYEWMDGWMDGYALCLGLHLNYLVYFWKAELKPKPQQRCNWMYKSSVYLRSGKQGPQPGNHSNKQIQQGAGVAWVIRVGSIQVKGNRM